MGTAGLISYITNLIEYGEYEIRPFFLKYYLNTIRRQIGGRNNDVLTDLIEEIGRSVFGATIEKEKLCLIINTLINSQDGTYDDVTVEMKFFEGQIGVENGRIDNINYENFNLGSIFRAASRHTVSIYIN